MPSSITRSSIARCSVGGDMSSNRVAQSSPGGEPREPVVFNGWFDSSLDLKLGLVVTEHGALDALADEPAVFAAWRPESPAASTRLGEQAHR